MGIILEIRIHALTSIITWYIWCVNYTGFPVLMSKFKEEKEKP